MPLTNGQRSINSMNRSQISSIVCLLKKWQSGLSAIPDALRSTVTIAEKCRFAYSLGRPVFPQIDLQEGETSYSVLWKAAFDGLKARYRPLLREAVDRLKYKLDIIYKKGFSEYFLIAKDIVDYCRSKEIPCVGRGSAADSLVSYVLGITQADPILYDLYFERFLNPERSEPPDIDLDICWKRRDEVLRYLFEKYGHDKTAMICTFSTFQIRSAISDVGKAFGLPEDEVRLLTKNPPAPSRQLPGKRTQKHSGMPGSSGHG